MLHAMVPASSRIDKYRGTMRLGEERIDFVSLSVECQRVCTYFRRHHLLAAHCTNIDDVYYPRIYRDAAYFSVFNKFAVYAAVFAACASTVATAVMLTIPRAVTAGVTMWTGRAAPIRIGPTGSASANTLISS